MRGAYLEPRKTVKRSLEDQVRQRDRGLERIADRVGQQAAAGEPTARLQFACAERMHEDEHTKFLAFGPERVEFGIGEFLTGDAAAHANAAEAEGLDRVFDLFRGEIGMLQCPVPESAEAVGVAGAE